MNAKPVLKAFLVDALNFHSLAQACLENDSKPSPSQIKEFLRVIHSLKGIASMISRSNLIGAKIAEELHHLEGRLCTRSPEDLSLHSRDWTDQARRVMTEVKNHLSQLNHQIVYQEQTQESGLRIALGFNVRMGSGVRMWVPLKSVLAVIGPHELGVGNVQAYQGNWIPLWFVMGKKTDRDRFGLVLETHDGRTCLGIEEVESCTSWLEAEKQGVKPFDLAA